MHTVEESEIEVEAEEGDAANHIPKFLTIHNTPLALRRQRVEQRRQSPAPCQMSPINLRVPHSETVTSRPFARRASPPLSPTVCQQRCPRLSLGKRRSPSPRPHTGLLRDAGLARGAVPGVLQELQPQRFGPAQAKIDAELWEAVKTGDLPTITSLLAQYTLWCLNVSSRGPSELRGLLNVQGPEGIAALHLAVMTKQAKVVELLLQKGARVEARTARGHTALHIVCLSGDDHICTLLLSWQAAINVQDDSHNTPLHYAVSQGTFNLKRRPRVHCRAAVEAES